MTQKIKLAIAWMISNSISFRVLIIDKVHQRYEFWLFDKSYGQKLVISQMTHPTRQFLLMLLRELQIKHILNLVKDESPIYNISNQIFWDDNKDLRETITHCFDQNWRTCYLAKNKEIIK